MEISQNNPGTTLAVKQPTSRENRVWGKLKRDRRAWFGIFVLGVVSFSAIFAPMIAPHDPNLIDMSAFQTAPQGNHLLGTDTVGRDVLSRLMYGSRVSLSVCVVVVLINVVIGTILGAIAGYYGKMVDQIIMRISDSILSFPTLVLVIVAVAVIGPSVFNLMIIIGLMGWPSCCRIVRGEIMSLRNEEFVTAAVMIGGRSNRIIFKHVLPNALAPIIVFATLNSASVILLEGTLSFLGMGVQQPTASWGNMLNDAQSIIILESMPWLWIPPGLAIAFTVLALNFVGDAMREAFDPTSREN